MAIEITRYTGRPLQDATDATAATGQKPAADAPAAKSARGADDKVSFTSSAALLQELEKEVAALPVVDSARVEAVQRQLATSSYQIDPARTAEKMLSIERALAGKD
jgi:negative regulator of flagellin synthesis FlgM